MNDSLPAPARAPLSQKALLTSITLGGMLVPLNSTMMAVALPDIMDAFQVDVSTAGWLVTAYLITMAALQLVAGKLGDQFGRRWLVLGGLISFGLSSLLAALSPTLPVLLAARLLQAAAGSIFITNGIPLVFGVVPENRRGRELGILSAILGLAAAAGPPLGGLLVSVASWRAIFWINIPIVLASLLLGWPTIPGSKPLSGASSLLDWSEIPSLFRNPTFASANGSILFSNLTMYMILLAIPILMAAQSSRSSLQTGLIMAGMSVTTAVFTPLVGRLSDSRGGRMSSAAGISLLTAGSASLAILGPKTNLPLLLACLLLIGIGLGISSVSLQTSVLESARVQQAGLVTGISTTSRYLGSILGTNLLAQILSSTPIQTGNFRLVFLIATISAGIALLMSWGISSHVERPIRKTSRRAHV